MSERTKKFTNIEFKKLARNTDGDIINLYDTFMWVTPAQKERLTGDDYSRVDEYEEEIRYMINFELGNQALKEDAK